MQILFMPLFLFKMIFIFCFFQIVFSQTVAPGWKDRNDVVQLMFKYDDEYLVDDNKGGTCNFGPRFGKLGVLMAANTPLYSGLYDYPKQDHDGKNGTPATKGDGCGVCYKVTGPGGSYIAVNADICDGCQQFPGVGPSFNLYDNKNSQRQIFSEVIGPELKGRGRLEPKDAAISIQKVSCPLDYFGDEGVSIGWLVWWKQVKDGKVTLASIEWTFVNYRVPITKVRAKVGDEDDWFELNRGWTNKFATKKGDPLYSTEKKYQLEITSETNVLTVEIMPEELIDLQSNTPLLQLGSDKTKYPFKGYISKPKSFQFNDYDGSTQPPPIEDSKDNNPKPKENEPETTAESTAGSFMKISCFIVVCALLTINL